MKTTDVTKEQLQNIELWREETEVTYCSQYGTGIGKKLVATLFGGFKVYNNKVCILECTQPYQALETYNNILPEFSGNKNKQS